LLSHSSILPDFSIKIKCKKLARLRRPKITYSPSYADYGPKRNAVILDMGHILRGEHAGKE
jgi:hypothetical protein